MATPRIARARSEARAPSTPDPNASLRTRKGPGSAPADKKSRTPAAVRIIVTETDIRDGVRALRRKCAIMRHVHDTAGDPPLRRRPAGFEGLARVIVGQQLSIASAAAIWERTVAACQPFEPSTLLALSDGQLAQAGLSRPKIRTLRAIATACRNGLDLAALEHAAEEEVHAALTEVLGIGPWTADIYIMFCLGRADGWAPGDLALQIAAQQALSLEERPSKDEMMAIAERWRPWRGVAARLLWTYYAAVKQKRPSVPVWTRANGARLRDHDGTSGLTSSAAAPRKAGRNAARAAGPEGGPSRRAERRLGRAVPQTDLAKLFAGFSNPVVARRPPRQSTDRWTYSRARLAMS